MSALQDALFSAPTDPNMPGQWRLTEVQLANWGTFDGAIYRIPIARKGHLLTGPSGSGKSSLLDAIAAVITPDKWLRFNQAAQVGGGRADQRTVVSYVRGAWSRTTDDTEDRVVSKFLRPGATWSGIILRYENEVDPPITLGRLFFLKGTSTSMGDLDNLCIIERSEVDLRDLEEFARAGLKTRPLGLKFPDSVITSNGKNSRYYARMRSLFGIDNETTLQLLHKTQSAKSLNTLDQLFREYMLERPTTFDLADNAVAQFGELRSAHEFVVRLRLQRDLLVGLQENSQEYEAANAVAKTAERLGAAVLPYQKHRLLDLSQAEAQGLKEQLVSLGAAAEAARVQHVGAQEDYEVARRRTQELGGNDIANLQRRIEEAHQASQETDQRWLRLKKQLVSAGIDSAPTSAAEFGELIAEIDRLLSGSATTLGPTHAQHEMHSSAQRRVTALKEQIHTLETSNSTVPERLLKIRQALAKDTSLPISVLPFAAELIEVKPDFASWTGAIERVLRSFALTLLVRSEHLAQVRRWVDSHQINARLVYEEVRSQSSAPRPARTSFSLVNRVSVEEGAFATWISGQLSQRFDYACVDSPDELGGHDRAVTIEGQIKSSATRYQKDDRTRIDDRSQWLLGNRESKFQALTDQLFDAQQLLATAGRAVQSAQAHHDANMERKGTLRGVRDQPWHEVDQGAAATAISSLQRRLNALTQDNTDLQAAATRASQAQQFLDQCAELRTQAHIELTAATSSHGELVAKIAALTSEVTSVDFPVLDPDTTAQLDQRFRKTKRSITRQNIYEAGQEVANDLHRELSGALQSAAKNMNEVIRLATLFKERWPENSADLSAAISDRQGFLDILDSIIANDLPKHEKKFLELLQDRSRDMVGELVSEIWDAPGKVEEKVRHVNESLRRSEFDRDRFLQLRTKIKRSVTVTEFIKELRSISEGSWSDQNLEDGERRFATLSEIMRRFSSSENIDKVWKNQCLDTRLHVTFLADEVDQYGHAHATYDSGAAMSGGQQQKLVIFCLAAALRYQLADVDDTYPKYGTIILDEAFDKADTSYTRMALDIFVEFGFHLVLATPQKLLQTIEPYVGAATSIENPNRNRTHISNVPWQSQS